MTTIEQLNKDYGLGEKLVFEKLGDELVVARINTELCAARVCLQGAQVVEWTPAGHKPVIWLSEGSRLQQGKSIRGGVPVCWPWFGAHESDSSLPAHGYARTVEWRLLKLEQDESGIIHMRFRLLENEQSRAMWPYDSPIELGMAFGETLSLELVTQNADSQPITISEALHTYFAISDIRQVKIGGLDGTDYLDKVQDFKRCTQQGKISFTGETDRVYVDTANDCLIEDQNWGRSIRIKKQGSQTTVVWNPWQEKADAMGDMGEDGFLAMVCVESANAADNIVTIQPGEEHRLQVTYFVE